MENKTWPKHYKLSAISQFIWVILVNGLGVIPGLFIFFVWTESNCHWNFQKPYSFFPYFFGKEVSLLTKCIWNSFLWASFGVIHSFLATQTIQRLLQKVIPPQLVRPIYIIITGINLMVILVNWETNDIYVWKLVIVNQTVTRVIAVVAFWTLYGIGLSVLTKFGWREFFGSGQLNLSVEEIGRTEGTPELVIDGLFAYVRHPLYTFSVISLILTPQLSLDRLFYVLLMLGYLVVAVPIEERKLIKIFGKAYQDYQKTTPMLFLNPFDLLEKRSIDDTTTKSKTN